MQRTLLDMQILRQHAMDEVGGRMPEALALERIGLLDKPSLVAQHVTRLV
jgi:hypothetical protein